MAIAKRGKAPKAEWVLMYRGGLTRKQIGQVVGAPPSTVSYHLRLALAQDPGLLEAHRAAAMHSSSRVTAQGLERMQQLVDIVQETGRYPSWNAESRQERTLAVWLQRRRDDARTGKLPRPYREGLDVLSGWEGKPRAAVDEERWQERLAALRTYRAAGMEWPRHKSTIIGEEHDLGVWLHTQRFKLRRGELASHRADALDATLPGWRSGRTRGRRPTSGADAK